MAYSFRKDGPRRKRVEHPKPTYPPDHKAGMIVPKGGSNCAKCQYLGADKKTCKNSYFVKWNGSNVIPGPIDSYCSDYFESA